MAYDPTGSNPTADRPGPEGAGPRSNEMLEFRCAEVNQSCDWRTSGRDESEMRRQIEQHGREKHGMSDLAEDVWDRIRGSFRRSAA